MEPVEEARAKIVREITSDDADMRSEYLTHFRNEVEQFAQLTAEAVVSWRSLDSGVKDNTRRAYVSAIVLTAITLNVNSMKLFISGQQIAAGNLFRQALEAIALGLVCSSKELDVLSRFTEGKYSTNLAIRDVNRHAEHLSLDKEGWKSFAVAQEIYNSYSHPTMVTIAAGAAFSGEGSYVGSAFDPVKLEAYAKEVSGRLSLANVLTHFVDSVKANVAKW